MSLISNSIKLVAKSTTAFLSSLLLFILGGLALNLFLIINFPALCGETSYCALYWLAVVLFVPGFVILYALVGYKYAIQRVIQVVYSQNKPAFYNYLTEKLTNYFTAQQKTNPNNTDWGSMALGFFAKLDGLSFVLRKAAKLLVGRIPLGEVLLNVVEKSEANSSLNGEETNNNTPLSEAAANNDQPNTTPPTNPEVAAAPNPNSPQASATRLTSAIDNYIGDEVIAPGWLLPLIVVVLNLSLFGFLHWWFR